MIDLNVSRAVMPPVLKCLVVVWLATITSAQAETASLFQHLRSSSDLGELRDLHGEWNSGVLKLSTSKVERYAWATVPAPEGAWDLARYAFVNADIVNIGETPVAVMFWIVGNHGWSAVVDVATLGPHESRLFSCDLRETFPDGTPKLNPRDIKQVQVMIGGPVAHPVAVEVRNMIAQGDAPEWQRPADRIEVPDVEDAAPTVGKRVRYRLSDDQGSNIYSVLNLPDDWQKGKKYPVIVEYPGNVFYTPDCYSTGLPDQCVIGYGISKGKGAICLGLPFVNRATGSIAENAWGNVDDTVEYAMQMVFDVCDHFGGDHEKIVLTGFSRGAIACGYVGLRDERIASLWKGFHACQHYDGGGWNDATLSGAIERAARFRGEAVFQTDNSPDKYQIVMDAMKTDVTWAQSGLGFHSTAMFLDDRASTQQLRQWFWQLVSSP